ncbi:hypothetical protein [Nonomuraea diastatica]|uniref:Uncharacterized protein n=1 Tax=Nonomuraea diastatica TaxID=1848329 RepID=A0A4R4VDJ7_9ACTN|nr:hypothetical protein [Nonomuraea diastatica]TDD03559.1 hypothetical protein E1294_50640 [Nonomuraea diastatica]
MPAVRLHREQRRSRTLRGPRRPAIESEDDDSGNGERLRGILNRRAKALKDGDEQPHGPRITPEL